ncbi:MAG: sugar phosphate isomerase/epimerase [Cellulomonadaceae bacterium]|jgi:sugar phosphate isomerase/epimerase|nr:sugar phosphate isomerase/epimerase [Cellulomonadaceae bacterium]
MRLGLLSAICDKASFDEVLDIAASIGYESLELCAWPRSEGATRRYAGVSHIDVDNLTDETVADIQRKLADRNITLTALGYYPNTITDDLDQRAFYVAHLKKMIVGAAKLGVPVVSTFIGRVQHLTIDENLDIFASVWPEIIECAEQHGIKVAIEHCPMLFDQDQWPGGQNLMTTPAIWRRAFEIIPSPNFGLTYDPSHFIWQMIDYIKPLYEFADRIFHVHYKDIKVFADKLNDHGSMAYPLQYMAPKLPGLGDVDWGKFVSALKDIGYSAGAVVEVEDKAFEATDDDVLGALRQSYRYMRNFVV